MILLWLSAAIFLSEKAWKGFTTVLTSCKRGLADRRASIFHFRRV